MFSSSRQMVAGGLLTSLNDTTILALLSRYPNMPAKEADGYISKIEHEENILLCKAVLGRIPEEELDEDSLKTYREFQRWSTNRTRRTRNEQWSARRRSKETQLTLRMNQLYQKGLITDEVLLMYGISGDMPEIHMYMSLTSEEKERVWSERMEDRYGPNWATDFRRLNIVVPVFVHGIYEINCVNWQKEGF